VLIELDVSGNNLILIELDVNGLAQFSVKEGPLCQGIEFSVIKLDVAG